MITIGMVSLGCPKNRVDGELIIGKLKEKAVFTGIPEEADVIIVNTCGFIESAKQESIDTILEMAELKKDGNLTRTPDTNLDGVINSDDISMVLSDYGTGSVKCDFDGNGKINNSDLSIILNRYGKKM